jgi:hypothetical protein
LVAKLMGMAVAAGEVSNTEFMRFSGFDATGQASCDSSVTPTFAGFSLLQWLAGPNQPEARG